MLFLTVNIVFGALGFLSPIAIEYLATNQFYPALKKQLDAAGPYTFSIAFLASTVVYVVAEYLDANEIAKYRPAKVMLSATAGLIIVCCALFSGAQTWQTMQLPVDHQPSSSAQSMPTSGGFYLECAHVEHPALPQAMTGGSLNRMDWTQIYVTLSAILVGLFLFLLFQYQSPSMQAQIAKFTQRIDSDAASMMNGLTVGQG